MTEGHDGGRDSKHERRGKTHVSPPVSLTLDSPLVRGGRNGMLPHKTPTAHWAAGVLYFLPVIFRYTAASLHRTRLLW